MSADLSDIANAEVLERIAASKPFLIGIKPAGEFVPLLGELEFLHAGPPLRGWEEACGALRGSLVATLVHAGHARDLIGAEKMAANGEIRFRSANDVNVLGTFAGVIGRNTPLLIVKNRATGATAGAAINEGRGRAVRYGSNDPDTMARFAWLEREFAPMLGRAVELGGGIDVFALLEQALQMGDDGHSKQKAASSLLAMAIASPLVEAGFSTHATARALKFLASNDIFFLPLTMGAAKATMVSAEQVAGSTVVTCMATNGVRFGIKTSSGGGRWFTAPVPAVEGHYFSGYSALDAGPIIGDSVISETLGLGAFAMSGAASLGAFLCGTAERASRLSSEMYRLTVSESSRFKIPALEYRGTPLGIDLRRVVESGLEPIFNSGIAHREPGIGQIGAGYGRVPLECFRAAMNFTEEQAH